MNLTRLSFLSFFMLQPTLGDESFELFANARLAVVQFCDQSLEIQIYSQYRVVGNHSQQIKGEETAIQWQMRVLPLTYSQKILR